MIRARFAVALAVIVALAALGFGFLAFMSTVRDKREQPGRLVQTRISNATQGGPVYFPLDEFFMSRGADGDLHALYTYPPGFFGHNRGCRVVWVPDEVAPSGQAQAVPGLFVDPCGGARFDRAGRLLGGEADRGLDYFEMGPGVEGFVVDTRTLWCGRLFGVTYPDDPTVTATSSPAPTSTPGPPSPSPRPGLPSPPPLTRTPAPASTITATASPLGTTVSTPTPDVGPRECDRVTSSSKR